MEIHEDRSDSHLLPGYRFCPVEEELILCYLCPKVKGDQVPGEGYLIFNSNLYGKQEPWEIWNEYEKRRKNMRFKKDLYFFTQRYKKTENGSRKNRTIGSGTWNGADAARKVYSGRTVIGYKRRFSYENHKQSVKHGRWIMLEFELDHSQLGMLDKQEAQKYVLCILRKNEKKKRVRNDKREKLATGDDVINNFAALDKYKKVKQEEFKIKQGTEDQGMHATGDNVCDAGPSLSSKLQEEESCVELYLNPKLFAVDDNLLPPYADSLQWGEEDYVGTQSSLACYRDNVQPLSVADHERKRKAESCRKKCLEHRPLVRPFTADREMMSDLLGEASYLSKLQCRGKCIYCDYVRLFASPDEQSNIYRSSKEHGVQLAPCTPKTKLKSSMVSTSTIYQPAMIASKSTSSEHRRADDLVGSNGADERLGAGAYGCRYTPWILSFAEELLRGAR